MNQQNAFERIAELEAKLKIATENCAAMAERLAAAEAVCERVDEMLVPFADTEIDRMIVRWRELKEKQ